MRRRFCVPHTTGALLLVSVVTLVASQPYTHNLDIERFCDEPKCEIAFSVDLRAVPTSVMVTAWYAFNSDFDDFETEYSEVVINGVRLGDVCHPDTDDGCSFYECTRDVDISHLFRSTSILDVVAKISNEVDFTSCSEGLNGVRLLIEYLTETTLAPSPVPTPGPIYPSPVPTPELPPPTLPPHLKEGFPLNYHISNNAPALVAVKDAFCFSAGCTVSATLDVPEDLRPEETLFLRAMVVGNDLEDSDEFVAETTVDRYQIQTNCFPGVQGTCNLYECGRYDITPRVKDHTTFIVSQTVSQEVEPKGCFGYAHYARFVLERETVPLPTTPSPSLVLAVEPSLNTTLFAIIIPSGVVLIAFAGALAFMLRRAKYAEAANRADAEDVEVVDAPPFAPPEYSERKEIQDEESSSEVVEMSLMVARRAEDVLDFRDDVEPSFSDTMTTRPPGSELEDSRFSNLRIENGLEDSILCLPPPPLPPEAEPALPEAPAVIDPDKLVWVCRECVHTNGQENDSCGSCECKRTDEAMQPEWWACVMCSFHNRAAMNKCAICFMRREPGDAVVRDPV